MKPIPEQSKDKSVSCFLCRYALPTFFYSAGGMEVHCTRFGVIRPEIDCCTSGKLLPVILAARGRR